MSGRYSVEKILQVISFRKLPVRNVQSYMKSREWHPWHHSWPRYWIMFLEFNFNKKRESFPGGSVVKNPPAMQGPGFHSWVRKIPWRKQWLPILTFLPGEFHGQMSLAGSSPWGHKQSDTTEWLSDHTFMIISSHASFAILIELKSKKTIFKYYFCIIKWGIGKSVKLLLLIISILH